MRYFLTLISLTLAHIVCLGFVYAETNTANTKNVTDITKPDYKIELHTLDPFNPTGVTLQGKEAVIGGAVSGGVLGGILGKITEILFIAIPLIAVISLVIAGYYYILSGGDSEKTTQAKTIIKWNLVAITVALLSYAIINIIAYILSGGTTN